jgi:hypothetical protein
LLACLPTYPAPRAAAAAAWFDLLWDDPSSDQSLATASLPVNLCTTDLKLDRSASTCTVSMIFTAGGLASPALAAMGEENQQHTYVFLLNVEERATAMECPCNLPVR